MSHSLETIIKKNAEQYYTTGEQKLSDDVFDAIVDKVCEENPESDILTTGWGYKPGSENKVKHKYCHIGSLPKTKSVDELIINKIGGTKANISAKLDGMSCVLYFENSRLIKAVTRGDGEYGIDITEKLHYVKGFTYKIYDKFFTGAVRGEILMTPKDYDKFKLKYPNAKNARNSTAGLINSNVDTVSPEDYGFLSLYVYTIVAAEDGFNILNTYNAYDWLENNFELVAPHIVCDITEDKLLELKTEYEQQVELDGLVVTSIYIDYYADTSCNVYNQVAFKFQDEIKISTVQRIEWTMSKHGAYIPVVVIDPLDLEGTTVTRVTGYNAKWIKDNKIKAGKLVAVRKSNQIIPQIVEVIEDD